jgi:hypothetical protein
VVPEGYKRRGNTENRRYVDASSREIRQKALRPQAINVSNPELDSNTCHRYSNAKDPFLAQHVYL